MAKVMAPIMDNISPFPIWIFKSLLYVMKNTPIKATNTER